MHQKRIARVTVSSAASFRWTAERGLMSKVWLITGASRGFGRAFTEAVLEAGDRGVATARNPEQLFELENRYSEKVCTCPLGVSHEVQTQAAFAGALRSLAAPNML